MSTVILYRGIHANDIKEANKFIKSTKSYNEKTFGIGMYLTRDLETAKSYGNFIYKFEINESDIWKKPTSTVTMLRKYIYKYYTPILIDHLDIDYYSFSGLRSWKERNK